MLGFSVRPGEGRVIMIGCPALQSELREVLLRPKFRQYGSTDSL